jgi:tRNA pseudouridine38-40 synthase
MQQYKMIIAYDGTDYAGWIQQKDQPSIVQTLHDSFERVFKKPITLLGASKTDAGVHALGQAAIFKSDIAVDTATMQWAWNNALPTSIMIRCLEQNDSFHPHYKVISKTYQYHLFFERPLPLYARYGAYISYPIDRKKFEAALQLFNGTHDFHAFYTGNDRHDTVRTIHAIQFSYLKDYNAFRVEITGEKFLRHMVRRMIGAALAVASRESITLEDIITALATRTVNYELPTAPAQGLMLHEIRYKD